MKPEINEKSCNKKLAWELRRKRNNKNLPQGCLMSFCMCGERA